MYTRDSEFRRGLEALRLALAAALSPAPALAGAGTAGPTAGSGAGAQPGWLLTEALDFQPRVGSGGTDADLAVSSEADADEAHRLIALVELARGGDSEAFGLLYDHYHTSVYRFIYYRVGSVALAEDLMSETFFRALRGRANFR